MDVSAFDFDLPAERIALRPAEPRESAKLLEVAPDGTFRDRAVWDAASLFRPGDLLIFNDTKVIPARLQGTRKRGDGVARVELTLHLRTDPSRWWAFARGAKRLAPGDDIVFADGALTAAVEERRPGGQVLLRFSVAGAALMDALASFGSLPLPPYIESRRKVDDRDSRDYQTIFADEEGAVAAPTAGLHFTPGLVQSLASAGIGHATVTLHVGAGTFLPVKADDTDDHVMHEEYGRIDEAVAQRINAVRRQGGRVVAVGTTSLRLLESAADERGDVQPYAGTTDIFIQPGYRFRAVDGLWTNFHLPRSTLFMLVSALCGLERMKAAYAHAIKGGYRFYSYGDASLLWPPQQG